MPWKVQITSSIDLPMLVRTDQSSTGHVAIYEYQTGDYMTDQGRPVRRSHSRITTSRR